MTELKNTYATVETKANRGRGTVEIPVWALPVELQQLHDEVQAARQELREVEHKFRKELHRFLSYRLTKKGRENSLADEGGIEDAL